MIAIRHFALLGVAVVGACASEPPADQPIELIGKTSAALDFDLGVWASVGPSMVELGQTGEATSHVAVTGRLTRVAANPLNPVQLFVGTANGGLFSTADYTATDWVDEGLPPQPIGAIAIDAATCTSSSCGTVWVGTGENSIRRDTHFGNGIAVGTKSGATRTWVTKGGSLFANGSITGLSLDPGTSGATKAVVATLSTGELSNPTQTTTFTSPAGTLGVYRSTDAGTNWSLVLRVPATGAAARATDLARDPLNAAVLFAGFENYGVYRSIDGGATWAPFNAGMNATQVASAQWTSITATQTGSTTTVIAALSNGPGAHTADGCTPQLYRLSGTTWIPFGPLQSTKANAYGDANGSFSRYDHHISVNPANPSNMVWSGVQLWETIDAGSTWTLISRAVHTDWHETAFTQVGGETRLLAVGDGGFYVRRGASPFSDRYQRGLKAMGFQSISYRASTAVVGSPTFALIGGTQDNSTLKFVGPVQWDHIDTGDSGSTVIDVADEDIMYDVYSYFDDGVRITRSGGVPGGSFFSQAAPPTIAPAAFYPPVVQDPSFDGLGVDGHYPLFTARDDVYRSYNRGASWVQVGGSVGGAGTTVYPALETTNVVTAIARTPADPQRLYVGYYDGQIFVTKNARGSTTWQRVRAAPSFAGVVTAIAVHPTNANEVYATISDGVAHPKVIGSIDAGTTWTDITGTLDATPINTIAIEPVSPYRLVIGRDNGVMYRASGLASAAWSPLGQRLPAAPVYAIATDGNVMFAATHGRGVFELGPPIVRIWRDYCYACVDVSPTLTLPPAPTSYGGYADIPVFAYGLPSSTTCSMKLFQNGQLCAQGSTDSFGRTFKTNAAGQLIAVDSNGFVSDHAWACVNGRCAGDQAGVYSTCLSGAVSSLTLTCGASTTSVSIPTPAARATPPATITGFGVPANLGQGSLAVDVALRDANGTERLLCTINTFAATGDTSTTVATRVRDALNADGTCQNQAVSASLTYVGNEEDSDRSPRVAVRVNQAAVQIVTRLRSQVPSLLAEIEGFSDGTRGVLVTPTLQVVANGPAVGGKITLRVGTFDGPCQRDFNVNAGDTSAVIINRIANGLLTPGTDCPGVKMPQVGIVQSAQNTATLSLRGARSMTVTTTDPSLVMVLASRSVLVPQNPPPHAPAQLELFDTPLVADSTTGLNALDLTVGSDFVLYAHGTWKKKRELLGPEVTWTSDDDAVATVVDGFVSAKKAGKVRIRATYGGTHAQVNLRVAP